MNFQYILFDLDGTITESGPGIINSVYYAVTKMGYEVEDKSELRRFIGPPLYESFQKYFDMTQEQSEEAVRKYREYYTTQGIYENTVYEGIIESLEKLKAAGKKLAIATSKPEAFAKQIAEHFDFAKYFDVISGASMDESLVAKADIMSNALKALSVNEADKNRVLMIGDREHDINGAKKNAVASMGVLYGYGDRAELDAAGANYIVETAAEISEVILQR